MSGYLVVLDITTLGSDAFSQVRSILVPVHNVPGIGPLILDLDVIIRRKSRDSGDRAIVKPDLIVERSDWNREPGRRVLGLDDLRFAMLRTRCAPPKMGKKKLDKRLARYAR